jgi:hypothetical protein
VTTGHSGTIVLDSKVDGPLMPAFSAQEIGNSLAWGLVHDAPNAFVWEIGHTGNYTSPAGKLCDPGSATKPPCYSYNVPTWLQFSPVQIKSVTFGPSNTPATQWATVSDLGGAAEVTAACGSFGGPFCTYPWYSYNPAERAFNYGGDYAPKAEDFGQAAQFATKEQCSTAGSPQYCATVINP